MIISHKYRCVYMCPAKTGTCSTEQALREIGAEPFVFISKRPPNQKVWRHFCQLPRQFQDYYIFATVRNPYSLAMSRFKFGHKREGVTDKITQKNFERFVTRKRRRTQVEKLTPSPPKGYTDYKICSFLKTESLEKDFNDLPFVKSPINMPHQNKAQNYDIYYTPALAKEIYDRFQIDFDTFGYSPIVPKNLARLPLL